MKPMIYALIAGLLGNASALADDRPTFTIHTGHFVKNDTGLTGPRDLLLLRNSAEFEKVFGLVTMKFSNARKMNPVEAKAFGTHAAVAVVTTAKAIITYTKATAIVDGDVLRVGYTAETGTPGEAEFASPLILLVPVGTWKRVEFVEDGQAVGTAK